MAIKIAEAVSEISYRDHTIYILNTLSTHEHDLSAYRSVALEIRG